jgi:hypothetical protein
MTAPHWRKSRRSDMSGNACVELARLEPTGPTGSGWRKSRRSDVSGNACVEIAELPAAIGVRDSKNPGCGHLAFDRRTAAALFSDIRAGRYDL